MSYRLKLRPDAEAEIAEAADWYEEHGAGLGLEFLRAVDAAVASVLRNPHRFQRVHGEKRRALLRRFSYALIFVATDVEIVFLACMHTHRDPNRWRSRV